MLILTFALLQTGTTCEEISGTNLEMEQRMEQERLAILEHPVVSGIADVYDSNGARPGFRVRLRCHTARNYGDLACGDLECGGLGRGVPVCVSKTRITLLECLQDLHKQVLRQHGPNRGAGFNLQEVIPPALEQAARSGLRTRGAGVRQVEGLGRKRFVLSADDDNDLRSRCE